VNFKRGSAGLHQEESKKGKKTNRIKFKRVIRLKPEELGQKEGGWGGKKAATLEKGTQPE